MWLASSDGKNYIDAERVWISEWDVYAGRRKEVVLVGEYENERDAQEALDNLMMAFNSAPHTFVYRLLKNKKVGDAE